MPAFPIENDTEGKQFRLQLDGRTAYSEYISLPDRIIFTHTEVPPALEGRGIAGALARTGLEWAEEQGKKVVPLCPFVAGYMARHPEWKKLLAPGYSVG